ncbi:MAG: phosphatase PAP2 family protein [Legionella sp.]|nr:phosphatase PAP2 family protein [Legionella sp.]
MYSFEKLYKFMKTPQVVIGYLLLVIMAYYFIDKPLAIYFHHLDFRTNAPMLVVLSYLGQFKLYIVSFFFTALFFRYVNKNEMYETRCWLLLICMAVPVWLNFILKVSFGRARPELFFLNNEYGFYWFKFHNLYWSFPSGHATTVISLMGGISLLFPRYFLVVFFLALFVIATRVVLYNHYLSDVMVAFLINVIVLGLLTEYLRKNKCMRDVLYFDKLTK